MAHPNDDVGILVVSGPDCGRFIPVTGRRQTIGRSTTCGIRLDDPALAPHHALMTGSPPEVDLRPLGGEVEHVSSGFRVGSTVCWWHTWPGSLVDVDSAPPAARPFHRPPPPVDHVSPDSEPPTEPTIDPEPRPATAPPWTTIIGGAVTGLTVAALTRQWLFAIFSVVTAGVALVTWGLQRIGQHRAHRTWMAAVAKNRHEFDRRCGEHARSLAQLRKDRHRTIGELILAARDGGPLLWAQRTIADVCIGFGSRQVVVVPGARPLAFNDIPVTVDLSAGSILGIHGSRAHSVAAAIIVRLAFEVGPSDWRLLTTEDTPSSWEALRHLPHLRREPLDQHDLAVNDGESVHDIVWVTDPLQVAQRRSIATRYLEHHAASMIVCARTRGERPSTCTTIIDADDPEVDGLGPQGVRTAMSVLRQWYDPDARQLALPTQARLLDIAPWSEEDIRRSWTSTSSSARADVGIGVEGTVSIDMDADGPHMIVVGTTGSGKSELLRTLVASMALWTSPAEVNFVLVDYKGGSAFDACARLPHVAGVVTDLDAEDGGKRAGRVLRGLEAELRRRELALRTVGVRDRTEYQRSRPAEPMPRLVIVVDELAALRVDVPDFVSALVSVAQRGRSLGLHLVLSTQRPGTELSADLVANVALRMALRLTSREDSRLVLGHTCAAAISSRTPGRGSMVVGADGPEDFQTLLVTDDLDEIVARCRSVADRLKVPPVRRPWCDALPRSLALPDDAPAWTVGMVDDPDEQRHFPLIWDRDRHLLVT
ncbi:MAG: FtsK/SpoIIIE domain-containing protein, partial [Ilumatobacteraceae bacterium]